MESLTSAGTSEMVLDVRRGFEGVSQAQTGRRVAAKGWQVVKLVGRLFVHAAIAVVLPIRSG